MNFLTSSRSCSLQNIAGLFNSLKNLAVTAKQSKAIQSIKHIEKVGNYD